MNRYVVALAVAKVALLLALASSYGYAATELYALACSDRLDWGYIGLPPLAAYAALAPRIVLGSALPAIRVFPALALGGLVLLTAALARRLGGGRYASLLAAVCVAASPPFVDVGATLSADVYGALAWTALAVAFVSAEQVGHGVSRLRVSVLLVVGVLATPPLVVLLAILPLAASLTFHAGRRGAWAGSMFAVGLLAPFAFWQVGHGLPALPVLRYAPAELVDHLPEVLLRWAGDIHVTVVVVVIAGVIAMPFLPRLRTAAPVVLSWVLAIVVFAACGLSSRAIVPLLPLFFALGAVAIDRAGSFFWSRWLRPLVAAAVLVAGGLVAPTVLPILAPDSAVSYARAVAPVIAWPFGVGATERVSLHGLRERLGWPELVEGAARAFEAVPRGERASTLVWARTRWQAAAIDRLGERDGLPRAVSGDGSYRRWPPISSSVPAVVAIGFRTEDLQPWFRDVTPLGAAECGLCPEDRRRVEFHVGRDPRLPGDELWARAIAPGP